LSSTKRGVDTPLPDKQRLIPTGNLETWKLVNLQAPSLISFCRFPSFQVLIGFHQGFQWLPELSNLWKLKCLIPSELRSHFTNRETGLADTASGQQM
jgi:hypothetical protein